MSGKQIALVAVLVVIAVAYLAVYVDWTRDELVITYELMPPRGRNPAPVYSVVFGLPTAMQFQEIEVTVAPEGATPMYGGVASSPAPAEASEEGEPGEDPELVEVSEQATQAGMRMDRLVRSPEQMERIRKWAADRNRSEPTFTRSYLVYGRRVPGMAREERPIRLQEGIVYRLKVKTVDGQTGEVDFATKQLAAR
ncbi:MAG: hypothetical protein AAGB29_06325 [Planctomycetota bacterium]